MVWDICCRLVDSVCRAAMRRFDGTTEFSLGILHRDPVAVVFDICLSCWINLVVDSDSSEWNRGGQQCCFGVGMGYLFHTWFVIAKS